MNGLTILLLAVGSIGSVMGAFYYGRSTERNRMYQPGTETVAILPVRAAEDRDHEIYLTRFGGNLRGVLCLLRRGSDLSVRLVTQDNSKDIHLAWAKAHYPALFPPADLIRVIEPDPVRRPRKEKKR